MCYINKNKHRITKDNITNTGKNTSHSDQSKTLWVEKDSMGDSLETIAMQIISFAGDAKADIFAALHAARAGDYEKASDLLKTAEEKITVSHQIHLKLLGVDGAFKSINEQLLISHAMDTLMTVNSEFDLTREIVGIIREVKNNSENGKE